MHKKILNIQTGEIYTVDMTEEEILARKIAHQKEQDELAPTKYQRDRKAEYPSIEALVVALWEGVVEERMAAVTQLETLRQAVKAKYPKG